jgi:hypothetical protein
VVSALHFNTNRRPRGTGGKDPVNSTDDPEELSLLDFPFAIFSLTVDSLLGRSPITRAFFASAAALGSRWSGRGMSGCGG